MNPPRESDCVFCRIVAGELPCHRVYEDDSVLAFLDIAPIARGHTVIIPRGHWATLDRVPADVAAAIGACLPAVGRAVLQAIDEPDAAWNVLQNNGRLAHQAVDHVHFHIIPKLDESTGLGIAWPATPLDNTQGANLAAKVQASLDHTP